MAASRGGRAGVAFQVCSRRHARCRSAPPRPPRRRLARPLCVGHQGGRQRRQRRQPLVLVTARPRAKAGRAVAQEKKTKYISRHHVLCGEREISVTTTTLKCTSISREGGGAVEGRRGQGQGASCMYVGVVRTALRGYRRRGGARDAVRRHGGLRGLNRAWSLRLRRCCAPPSWPGPATSCDEGFRTAAGPREEARVSRRELNTVAA